jgi:hypothetical protein
MQAHEAEVDGLDISRAFFHTLIHSSFHPVKQNKQLIVDGEPRVSSKKLGIPFSPH